MIQEVDGYIRSEKEEKPLKKAEDESSSEEEEEKKAAVNASTVAPVGKLHQIG